MAFEERYMVPTILHIDIRIEMRYKHYTEMHLTKCDASMNMKMSRSKTTYMYICSCTRCNIRITC